MRSGTYEEEQSEEQSVEIAREQTEVVVCGRGHAVENRGDSVQDEHRGGVCDKETNCRIKQH